jgi:hypothetical protein
MTITVLSVSLGSSKRDKRAETDLLGEHIVIERRGTDGNLDKACKMIAEYDGKVDAFGLGGIDLYLWVGPRKYVVRDALRMARCAMITPVVDGSGLKNTLERRAVDWVANEFTGEPKLKDSDALLVSGIDRTGMAQALAKYARTVNYGDLAFAVGVPVPIRSFRVLCFFGYTLLPIYTRLPFHWIYPVGDKQDECKPKFVKFFNEAQWICGDFNYIKRYAPFNLKGKVVLTNTTTDEDVTMLRERGVKWLITTTPVFDGRSFGTNLLEAVIISLIKQHHGKDYIASEADYEIYLNKLELKPAVREL